jgi:hypothetical protein
MKNRRDKQKQKGSVLRLMMCWILDEKLASFMSLPFLLSMHSDKKSTILCSLRVPVSSKTKAILSEVGKDKVLL